MADGTDCIDPRGDVLLICGSEADGGQRSLQVSSAIMAVGSSVFKAMLDPRFKEGTDLQAATEPYKLPLPEEDPAAMQIICQILHHRNLCVPRSLEPDKLVAVAVVSDKYDCSQALLHAASYWYKKSIKLTKPETDAKHLLTACLFKHPELIQAWSARIALHATYDAEHLATIEPRLPPRLLANIDEEKRNAVNSLSLCIQEFLAAVAKISLQCTPFCILKGDMGTTIMKLYVAKLWPLSPYTDKKLVDILAALEKMSFELTEGVEMQCSCWGRMQQLKTLCADSNRALHALCKHTRESIAEFDVNDPDLLVAA